MRNSFISLPARLARCQPGLALLLLLLLPALASAQTILTGPTGSGTFGANVTVLTNGNYVVTDPTFTLNGVPSVGAVYLYNGTTNALLSTLTGSQADDQVGSGGVTALTNGNYLAISSYWANGSATRAGAVTWGNGSTGITGVVSTANSLTGSQTQDYIGNLGATVLSNGNYVVNSPRWANGAVSNVGAVTWGNGSTGTSGVVSTTNSLTGSHDSDAVSFDGVIVLTNGNYVVRSSYWNHKIGAVTWGNGSTGTSGVVSAANSLIGSQADDQVSGNGVTALSNGNYVVSSANWNNGAVGGVGAATWGNGTTGTSGPVSAANSLIGSQIDDHVGTSIKALSNGNYVVSSLVWHSGTTIEAGAATWGNGSTGTTGVVSAANSLTGSQAYEHVGGYNQVTALSNGNYVLGTPLWDNGGTADVGAITWGNGTTGTSGVVSAANSLTGSQANDQVGNGVTALSNGNYVVGSSYWANGAVSKAGAATWCNGTTGITGVVSAANSLTGSQAGDQVSLGFSGLFSGVTALSNGNYVVCSPNWANGAATTAGAATWGNGTTGTTGVVSVANSLTGSQAGDRVGTAIDGFTSGVRVLSNSNYVVCSFNWANGAAAKAGASTWGNGSTGTSGAVSTANSLTGSQAGDQVGIITRALINNNYLVGSPLWANGAVSNAGALTLGIGSTGTKGPVTGCNSIVGSVANGGFNLSVDYMPATNVLLGGLPDENKVQLGNGPPAPTGAASQSFAAGATVASLAATGTALQWYAAASAGPALAGTTPLANGTTYYASQTIGGCESTNRLAVAATVAASPAGPLVVSTGDATNPVIIAPNTYTTITITSTGYGQLGGAVVVNTAFTVSGGLNTNCQALTGAGSFTLSASGTLAVCDVAGIAASGATGAVQVTGTRSFSADASYLYNGTADQNTGNGLPATVRNLSTTNANPVTLTQAVVVNQVLTVGGSGAFDPNGNAVTLRSTATGTALLVNSGTGQVSNSITAERYIDPTRNAGLGYRHLAAPVNVQDLTPFSSGGGAIVQNAQYNTSATPGTVTPFPTIFAYSAAQQAASPATTLSAFDKGWMSPGSQRGILGKGFTMQLSGGQTLRFTGRPQQADRSLPLRRDLSVADADGGWNLMGNPYAAPLDFSTVLESQRSNMDAAVYIFESTGQYVGTYRTYLMPTGSNPGVGSQPLAGSGQAFFLRVTAGQASGSLDLTNANRVTDYARQQVLRRGTADPRPQLQLALAGNGSTDGLTVYTTANATAALDANYDAAKLANPTGLNLATLTAAGQQLAIDGRPAVTAATSIPLFVGVPAAGRYTLSAATLANLAGTRAELVDNLTNTRTLLTQGAAYAFTTTTTTAPGRFWLNLSPAAAPLATSAAALAAQVLAYPNPSHGRFTILRPAGIVAAAELLNSLGQRVRTLNLPTAETTVDLSGLATGVYTLRLTLDGLPVTKRLVIE